MRQVFADVESPKILTSPSRPVTIANAALDVDKCQDKENLSDWDDSHSEGDDQSSHMGGSFFGGGGGRYGNATVSSCKEAPSSFCERGRPSRQRPSVFEGTNENLERRAGEARSLSRQMPRPPTNTESSNKAA